VWAWCGVEDSVVCDENERRNGQVSSNLCASNSARHTERASRGSFDFKRSISTCCCETLPCSVSTSTNFSPSCWAFSWSSFSSAEIIWRLFSTNVDTINWWGLVGWSVCQASS